MTTSQARNMETSTAAASDISDSADPLAFLWARPCFFPLLRRGICQEVPTIHQLQSGPGKTTGKRRASNRVRHFSFAITVRHGIYLFSFFPGFGCQQLTFCSTFCMIVVCFFSTQQLLEHQQSFQPHAVLHAQEISGYHPLRSQFKQAATLISARVDRQAERDFFFIEDGGWDSHKGVENALYTKWLAGNF